MGRRGSEAAEEKQCSQGVTGGGGRGRGRGRGRGVILRHEQELGPLLRMLAAPPHAESQIPSRTTARVALSIRQKLRHARGKEEKQVLAGVLAVVV
eukprot:766739-Hanusia_phi.AAC.2